MKNNTEFYDSKYYKIFKEDLDSLNDEATIYMMKPTTYLPENLTRIILQCLEGQLQIKILLNFQKV